MSRLTTAQNKEVIRLINRKELASAEIISEVYDHYLCHLERFDESQFEEQLNELEEKFTCGYCHALQFNFAGNFRKELRRLQWDIIKSYFYFPRLIYTIFFIIGLVIITLSISNYNLAILFLYVPIFFILGFSLFLIYRHYSQLRLLKKLFYNQKTSISSTIGHQLILSLVFPALMANAIVQLGNTFFNINFSSFQYMSYISLIISIMLFLYSLPFIEIWRLKSKFV